METVLSGVGDTFYGTALIISLSKNLYFFENGCLALLALLVLHRAKLLASNQSILALGVAPMRVVSRWCRCVMQRLCATDCKHPCLVRAAAPHSAPARMPGVYAARLCRTQSPQSVLIGIENSHYLIKNRLFLQTESPERLLMCDKEVIEV